jgi:hypothetical protein
MAARINQTRRPSPAGFDPSFGKSSVEIAGELGRGAKDGIVDLAADAARLDLLHVPAGLARLARSAWSSGGGLGGLVSVVLEPAREQVAAAADRAAEGDFRGAAAAGVKAIGVAVTTGIAVGELGAAAVGAAQTAHSGPAASGARSPRAANAEQRANALERSRGADGVERCVYCDTPLDRRSGSPSSVEIDHRKAYSNGGKTVDSNLDAACRTCNRSKGSKDLGTGWVPPNQR